MSLLSSRLLSSSRVFSSLIAVLVVVLVGPAALAQGSPLPGDNMQSSYQPAPGSAPMPGAQIPYQGQNGASHAPVPGGRNAGAGPYAQLPLNLAEAKTKVSQLRSLITTARPHELETAVDHMNEWLSDMQDAHSKMSNAFAKHDSTKAEAQCEKQAATAYWQLKHQLQLIKAELLIRQNRYPEALAPLVDIVVAEPLSDTGKKAYDKLKELGFSQQAEPLSVESKPQAAASASAKVASQAPAAGSGTSKAVAHPPAKPVSVAKSAKKK